MKRILLLLLLVTSCGPQRAPVPPGTVPTQSEVPISEEDYGQQVLESLTERFPLDRDDGRINRVRDIVARLTRETNNDANPWHAYVLVDDEFKNAAATRGNHLFVWTGMLKVVEDDEELATILSHEIAHVISGHTSPTPAEAVTGILSGTAGDVAREILYRQGGSVGALAGLADLLVTEALNAFLVNPEQQRKELEADHVGLFMMAEAGYDPEKAISFWERMSSDPAFAGFPIEFLSSHPSSEERLAQLLVYLPQARLRYENRGSGGSFGSSLPSSTMDSFGAPNERRATDGDERWVVVEDLVTVYTNPDDSSAVLTTLRSGATVSVKGITGRWLQITEPENGFVRSYNLAPINRK